MDPYKTYGRGGYGRNMNGYNSQRNMNNSNYNQRRTNNYTSGCNCQGQQDKINNSNKTNISSGCGCSNAQDNRNDCRDENPHMRHMSVGIGYVPMQPWGELYEPDTALCQGTAFPDLNLIFCGSRGKM